MVVTEKLDGECTTIHAGGCYARSLDTAYHESRSRVRGGDRRQDRSEHWLRRLVEWQSFTDGE